MRATVDSWAAEAVARLSDGARVRFMSEPFAVIGELGIRVRAASHLDRERADGGACDGVSYLDDGVILYRPTGNQREFFTLAHEVGHFLVLELPGIYDWLFAQENSEKLLETVCDRIAHLLLVPDSALRSAVGSGPAAARHIVELSSSTLASRPVCAIAVASELPGTGAVVLIDRADGVVLYSSVRPDPDLGWPGVIPWPGQSTPSGHPLLGLAAGSTLTRKTFWATPWGSRENFYVDAVVDRSYVVAVFSDRDLWNCERLHLDGPREFVRRPEATRFCCGERRQVRGFPCPACGAHFCPVCRRCECDRRTARDQTCQECGMEKQKHLLDEAGVCVDCI